MNGLFPGEWVPFWEDDFFFSLILVCFLLPSISFMRSIRWSPLDNGCLALNGLASGLQSE